MIVGLSRVLVKKKFIIIIVFSAYTYLFHKYIGNSLYNCFLLEYIVKCHLFL